MNIDVIINILSFGFGALVIYLTAYLKVKGKNKGLIEDISNLENEKQKIIAKYRVETEEVKKQHSLDIEKRKFQYEDKRAQFSKYFALLDKLHSKCNAVFLDKFQAIMTEFLSGHLENDESIKNKAIVKCNKDIQALVFELNEEHLKVKSEQNSIRLIASSKVDELLDRLEVHVKLETDASTEMLKVMSTPEFWIDQTIISPYKEKLMVHGQNVQLSQDRLKEQMKSELNEI